MHCCGGSGSEDYEEKAKLICCESDPCEPSDIVSHPHRSLKADISNMLVYYLLPIGQVCNLNFFTFFLELHRFYKKCE